MSKLFLSVFLFLFLSGCSGQDHQLETGTQVDTEVLSERDQDIIRYVIETLYSPPKGKVFFLTVTPMKDWGATCQWADLPPDLRQSISHLPIKYRPASEATMTKAGLVVDSSTNEPGWMRWVTVDRWVSDTEVYVESGDYVQGGFGSSIGRYIKVDGKWQEQSREPSTADFLTPIEL